MCDLISDVITCCVWCCDTGKINASAKIMFKLERAYMEIKFFLHKSPSKRSFTRRIHNLLRRADARWCDDIIWQWLTFWATLNVCRRHYSLEWKLCVRCRYSTAEYGSSCRSRCRCTWNRRSTMLSPSGDPDAVSVSLQHVDHLS